MIVTVRAPADVHPRDVRTCGPLDTHRPCFTVVVYQATGLVSINGMLWRSHYALFCAERLHLEVVKRFILELYNDKIRLDAVFHVFTTYPQCYILRPVGLTPIRAIQRRFRRPGRRLALAMALHARLGAGSPLQALGEDLLRPLCT